MSKLNEIMAESGVSHPLALDVLMNSLIKSGNPDDGHGFLEDVDLDELSFDDLLKLYKKSSSLLYRGSKSVAKFGAKVARENKKSR